ncbi:carboxypeptidase-like regulatory domain-containing protein [Myxococcus sp. K38C18041901]|uniref:carboxypeptidase-like regulatory domain-containing protein n=1 Tax=Myxococcus guangdongensis TaxID=2906760 RepID=UPI0020A810D1|nr:carboxypeptidase-like regulatory domain-containing protein [Myxococcus guangdongensis]MCP3060189.1 carboxypeptidase-like regulatory domain-containing protein [Myxococcus guangdongensis]
MRWMWLCGALSGTLLLGASCDAPERDADAPVVAEYVQPLATCIPSTSGTTICGLVIDEAGTPLSGATVRMGSVVETSAANGSFSVTALVPMGAPVTIELPGYMPYVGAAANNVLRAAFVLHSLHRQTFSASGIVSVTDPRNGASIQVNLSLLRGPKDEQVQGPFTVGVRHLDTGLLAMPGTDGAVNLAGKKVFLESRGAIYTEVRDGKGQILKLAPGTTASVFVPLTRDLARTAPADIAFWSMPVGSNQWRQQASNGIQSPNPVQCSPDEVTVTCDADLCSRISKIGFVADTDEIGFINADIEKTEPACLRIEVDEAKLPPGTVLPICLGVEIPLPTGGSQTREFCVGAGTDVLYNLPPNVNLVVRRAQGYGCPPAPGGSVVVNTGAPWGGTDVPSKPDECNGVLKLPPLP